MTLLRGPENPEQQGRPIVFCSVRLAHGLIPGEDAVNRRSIVIPLALLGSAGIALVPAFAEAATPPSSAPAFVKTTQTTQSAAALARETGAATYASPASASKLVRASATTPNPGLAVALTAESNGAFEVDLTVTVSGLTSGTASLAVNWGDNGTTNVDAVGDGAQTYQYTYTQTGAPKISVTADDGSGDTAANSLDFQTLGSSYTSDGPWRVLDTRNGIGAKAAPVAAHGTLALKVGGEGTGSIPNGVTAVVLNVTATDETANGVLTAYGDENLSGAAVPRPITSNVNYLKGRNTPNLAVVPVGKNGVVDFYNNSAGSTDIVADVQGYFSPTGESEYAPVTPTRIIDTRKGLGTGKVEQIPANGTINVPVAGAKGGVVPASALGVAVNLTAVDATKNGVITANADDGTVAGTSNLNYTAGGTSSNMALVPVGVENPGLNEISIHNGGSGPVDVVADVFGYYGSLLGSAYVPLAAPVRVVDTRQEGGPLNVGTGYPEPFPFTPATAGIFNATVTEPTGNGYLTLYPYNPGGASAVPGTSNLNYLAGQTVPSLAFISPGTVEDTAHGNAFDYGIHLSGKGTAQVIIDWFGYFQRSQ
jgi:hypothetical protein